MKNLKAKLRKNGGFTLIEMLIVVAIIAILIAVSIPLVGNALDRTKQATDAANERAAKAEVMVEYLSETYTQGTVKCYDAVKGSLEDAAPNPGYGKYTQDKGVLWVVMYNNVVYMQWTAQSAAKPDAPTAVPDATSAWKTSVTTVSAST